MAYTLSRNEYLTANQRNILLKMAYASQKRGFIDYTVRQMSIRYKCCERTIQRILAFLRKFNLLEEENAGAYTVLKRISNAVEDFLKNPFLWLQNKLGISFFSDSLVTPLVTPLVTHLPRKNEPPIHIRKEDLNLEPVETDSDSKNKDGMAQEKTLTANDRKNIYKRTEQYVFLLQKCRSTSDNLCSVISNLDEQSLKRFCNLPMNLAVEVANRWVHNNSKILFKNPSASLESQCKKSAKAWYQPKKKHSQIENKAEITILEDFKPLSPCYTAFEKSKETTSDQKEICELYNTFKGRLSDGWELMKRGMEVVCKTKWGNEVVVPNTKSGVTYLSNICESYGSRA